MTNPIRNALLTIAAAVGFITFVAVFAPKAAEGPACSQPVAEAMEEAKSANLTTGELTDKTPVTVKQFMAQLEKLAGPAPGGFVPDRILVFLFDDSTVNIGLVQGDCIGPVVSGLSSLVFGQMVKDAIKAQGDGI